MSTIKSSTDHLTLNADGASKDIKFQANGVEKASISSAGAFTSTTIDATKLTGTVPTASLGTGTADSTVHLRGDGTWAVAGGGKVLQIVYDTHTGASNTSSETSTDVGLTLSITPTSASSKIILGINMGECLTATSTGGLQVHILRGTTNIGINDGTTLGYTQNSYGIYFPYYYTHIDSPNTTSSVTYEIRMSSAYAGKTVYVMGDGSQGILTAMEVEV